MVFSHVGLSAPKINLLGVGIDNKNIAVIINTNDALSREIAKYYQEKHSIPDEHLFYVSLSTDKSEVSVGEFAVMKRILDSKLPKTVQAIVLTWASPYRVGCMSITSAFTFGFDQNYCASSCRLTAKSRYYGSSSRAPFTDHGIRPTMAVAATSFDKAKQLIDRGAMAGGSINRATALLVSTSDKARNVRLPIFEKIKNNKLKGIDIKFIEADVVRNQKDVMFYFTGQRFVEDINTNYYLPGAIADHLTSFGGRLVDSSQMSAIKWLELGLTGSYGTVVEPCSFPEKFPNPEIVINNYHSGETLIEAYWKSVIMPGQGIFIGDPLAKPYNDYSLIPTKKGYRLLSPYLKKGTYQLLGKNALQDDFTLVNPKIVLGTHKKTVELTEPLFNFYQLQAISSGK